MNEIINNKHKINVEFGNNVYVIQYEENIKKKYKNYKLQFVISSIVAILFCLFFLFAILKSNIQEKKSKKLLSNYNLTTIYQNNVSHIENSSNEPFIIGIIKIDKINLNYPILSESNDDLLKISLCRFSGPMPNENGNLCIAGHNYIDNRFFGEINKLINR